MKIIFSKTDFFSKIFQSARNSHKVLPHTFKNNHKEIVLLEKVRAGRFCRAGDPGSISKIPKKKKADVEALL